MIHNVFNDSGVILTDVRTDEDTCVGFLELTWTEQGRPMSNIFDYQSRKERKTALIAALTWSLSNAFPFAD